MISAFPVRFPLGVVGGLLIGLGLGLGAAWWTVNQWPEEQKFYWTTYYQATMDSAAEKFGRPPAPRAYFVLAGGKAGVVRLSPGKFQDYLQKNVYDGKTWLETVKVPGLWLLGCVFVAGGIGKRFDVLRQRGARWGEHVRGTRLVTWRQANREALRAGATRGVSIPVGRWPWQKLTIPLDLEAYHFGICSSTGMGKTTLIRWILKEVEARGETAIIYDPKGEYRDEFYSEERGDVILDPTDERCPYWAIESEAVDEATATPWGKAFFPEEPREQPYFKKHPREIISFLLDHCSFWHQKAESEQVTCKNLAQWVARPNPELQKRLKGTTYAVDIDPVAKNQSQGLLSTLGEIAKPLRMMPARENGRQVFSVREWSQDRQGWIFMTSTPDTVDALLPLQSAIMDMLILKNQAWRRGARKVWFVIDELASMQRLPQLESAMTKQRASGNPMIIGYHDVSQLKDRYGENQASTIVSQPFTNIFLRTGSGTEGKHSELQIAHEEVERITENRSAHLLGHRRGRSWNSQLPERAVVMAAEIQSLPRFRGYFLQEGRVVKINVQDLPKRVRTERIERLIPPLIIHDETPGPEGKPVPVDDMPPSWPEGMPVETSVGGFGDPYMLALAVNAKRIAQADKRDGMTRDDYEGPPVTRFICGKCKTIVDFDGVLEEPGSLCPKCHAKFYSRSEGYVRNTIMEPHRKSGKSSIPKKPMASLHADKRQDENPILAILGRRDKS